VVLAFFAVLVTALLHGCIVGIIVATMLKVFGW
jgi:hypothetical protein